LKKKSNKDSLLVCQIVIMDTCPIELTQLILEWSDFLSQIRFRCVSKNYHARLEIHDFSYSRLSYGQRLKLSDAILQAYPFIIKLHARRGVTDVNHMTKLRELNSSCIGNDGIRNCNLAILRVRNNSRITNINHMTNLEILDASGECGIGDAGISKLNLVDLDACSNPRITNVNHMTRLQKLNAQYICGIDNAGIANLNLIELHVCDNPNITDLNYMTNLRKLGCEGENCGISDSSIRNLKLREISAINNRKITDSDADVCAADFNLIPTE